MSLEALCRRGGTELFIVWLVSLDKIRQNCNAKGVNVGYRQTERQADRQCEREREIIRETVEF